MTSFIFNGKYLTILFLSGLLCLLFFQNNFSLKIPQAEASIRNGRIKQFSANIKIKKNADVLVEEKIIYDFGDEQKHGIFRFIPVKYSDKHGFHRSIKITDIKVLQDGQPAHWQKKRKGKNIEIKIGEADKLISGEHTYQISYLVRRAINYFPDHSEFYWNVTGAHWLEDMQNVSVQIQAPDIQKALSFRGEPGSGELCSVVSQTKNQIVFNCQNISAGEEVTVVVAFPPKVIQKPGFWQKLWYFFQDNSIFSLPLLTFIFMFWQWRQKGKDPKGRGTIIPYYDIPDNLSVGEAAFLWHGHLPNSALSAMLIQLAVKGWLKIKEVEKGGLFKKAKYVFLGQGNKPKEKLSIAEMVLFEKLFSLGSNGQVKSENLAYNFYRHLPEIKKQVGKSILRKGYFKNLPSKVVSQWMGIASFLMLVAFFSSSFLGLAGFLSVIFSALIIMGFALIMPRYTKKGALIKEKLAGFKLYLETAEKDRIKFHNAPEKKPEMFEKFLPYAMIFGVEKEWAKQFQDIYRENPDWYEGASANLNSLALVNSLDSFNSTINSSLSSSYSSASSGGSGFSGGGAGGGFGGGGGGSW